MTFLLFRLYFVTYITPFIPTWSHWGSLTGFWFTVAYDIDGRRFHFCFARKLSLFLQYSLTRLQLIIVVPPVYIRRFVELRLELSLSFKWFSHVLLFACYIFDGDFSKPWINWTVFLLIFSKRCIGPEHR